MGERMWTFKTENFEVFLDAEPELDADLSWADEETLEKIESGYLQNICWHAGVINSETGNEIGTSYLGNSVYENPRDFVREHLGIKDHNRKLSAELGREVLIGSYFTEMVREAIAEARKSLAAGERLRAK